jgi:ribonuclease BN (tRNA processing enzyme)
MTHRVACLCATLFLGNIAHAAPPATIELIVLGSGGPRAFGRACSSYVVLIEGTPRILVDAGPGTFVRLGELGLDLEPIETVLLTHFHIDHSGDLPGFFKARTLSSRGPIRFKVFGPAGGVLFPGTTRFLQLLFEKGGAFEYQKTFGVKEDIQGTDLSLDMRAPEREIVSTGGWRVTEIATHHGDCPSIAYRVDYKNRSVTFSGDMDASALPNLERLAEGSDLLVFHCAVLDPPGSPAQLYDLHTPPRKIGEAARAAGVKRLLLSHIPPVVEQNREAVLASIRGSYQRRTDLATDRMRIAVSAP